MTLLYLVTTLGKTTHAMRPVFGDRLFIPGPVWLRHPSSKRRPGRAFRLR
jgi:hypothetical protein